MKAIQVAKAGGPEQLIYQECPTPIASSKEVLVKQKAIGINFIDIYIREGLYRAPSYPYIPGKEGAGEVVAVGSEVRDIKVGDRVSYWNAASGAYAEYAVVPEQQAVQIPDGLDFETAAATMLQGLTAYYLSHLTILLKPEHTVLIHAGAGGVGLLLIQLAKLIGAKVITTVSSETKTKYAKAAGADHIILYTKESFQAAVMALTNNNGVDVVYDSIGKDTFYDSLASLTVRGMLVSFGQSSGVVSPLELSKLSEKSLYLTRPSLFHYAADRQQLQSMAKAVFDYILKKQLQIQIGQRYPLRDAATAHRDLAERRTVAKSILLVD